MKPTKAHSSQRWPMQAHSGQRRPMQGPRQPMQANEVHSAAIDDRYVCFLIYILFFVFYITTKPVKAHSSHRRQPQAHSGQRRPMQGQRQPTQANEGHSAAINDRYVCFLVYILFFVFLLLQSTRRPTAANKGQCRPTKTKKGPTSASICPPQPPTSHHDSLVVTPLLLLE